MNACSFAFCSGPASGHSLPGFIAMNSAQFKSASEPVDLGVSG